MRIVRGLSELRSLIWRAVTNFSQQLLVLLTIVLWAAIANAGSEATNAKWPEGRVRFLLRTSSSFDRYTQSPSERSLHWLFSKVWRLQSWSPYFDARLAFFPRAVVYEDLYAIYKNTDAASHSDWILKDSGGHPLYIPWGCSAGACPQFAADPGNAEFRQWWIERARLALSKGYLGLWIDDVNLALRVGNADGQETIPVNPRTKSPMSVSEWRQSISDFTGEIRRTFRETEIFHNAIWFAGKNQGRWDDAGLSQISSADFISLERGFSDPGLTGGEGEFSLNSFLSYIDKVHSQHRHVVVDELHFTSEYPTAGYLLINDGFDALANQDATPDRWAAEYDVNLGKALGARYRWQGLWRRDFENGTVVLNGPGGSAVHYPLPWPATTVAGKHLNSLDLNAKSALILIRATP